MIDAVLYFGPHTRAREAGILCRHRRYFSLFRRSARLAGRLLAQLSAVGHQKLLAAALFGRMHEAAQAGARLAQAGLERDVAISVRATMELFVKLKATCVDADFVTRYKNDDLLRRKRLASANLENPDLEDAVRARLQRSITVLDKAIDDPNAQELKLVQLAREVGLAGEYGTVFRMTSPFVHGSGRALDDYTMLESGRFAGVEFGPTDDYTDIYLSTLAEYLLRASQEIGNLFGIDVRPHVDPLYHALAAITPEWPVQRTYLADAEGSD